MFLQVEAGSTVFNHATQNGTQLERVHEFLLPGGFSSLRKWSDVGYRTPLF